MNDLLIHMALAALLAFAFATTAAGAAKRPTEYVNPFLGTATLWDKDDLGFTPTHRAWGAEVFPGASLPNAMVQVTPVTMWRSGSGYQYEDATIHGFVHTSKGHWNLCHVPFLPATGEIHADDYASPFDHDHESAQPGYYQVLLQRYGINVELTSTLRCGFHRYTFRKGDSQRLIADLAMSNERVRNWKITQDGPNGFSGFQETGETLHFYAVANRAVRRVAMLKKKDGKDLPVVDFADGDGPLELRVGFSFVSLKNAKENLAKEMQVKSFDQVRADATKAWDALLDKVRVTGGTERERGIFYSCLYRSFLWPSLRSDINGDFVDQSRKVVNKGFRYYTNPSFWDDYRNKLVLLGMLSPDVTVDVIKSLIDKGEHTGFMPTFFHGDHAAAYIAGMYVRGIRGYDVRAAYRLLMRNATVEGGTRPHITEYMEKGFISEPDLKHPLTVTVANAGVTKTLEYAYDDYALALLAKELNETDDYAMLMKRTQNYRNVFDPATTFMRGRLANGDWIEKFDPQYPYYEYMYREANAWQQTFFVPHDVDGLIGLFGGAEPFEKKLDDLFTIPWEGYEVDNLTVFIGQYCHGNQPGHNYPYLYTFIGKPEKTQAVVDHILDRFYDMGEHRLAYCGMDDAGEMSSWYVFNAIGLYTFSPADPEYIVTAPLFDKVEVEMGDGARFTISRKGSGRKIREIAYDGRKVEGHFISHADLLKGKELAITTE